MNHEAPTDDEMSAMTCEFQIKDRFRTLLNKGLLATAMRIHRELEEEWKKEIDKEKDAA